MLNLNKEEISALSDWLVEFHSHGIYAAEALSQLDTHFTFDCDKKTLTANKSGEVIHLPLYHDKKFRKEIKGRGLGGSVCETDELMFGGYQMAESLAAQVLNFHSGKMGRGSRHHECLSALRKAG